MFAYVGLGPGQEYLGYFLALLVFLWTALLAVLQWPLMMLLRWLGVRRRPLPAAPAAPPQATVPPPETPHDAGTKQP